MFLMKQKQNSTSDLFSDTTKHKRILTSNLLKSD